jgi:hypothetical protein
MINGRKYAFRSGNESMKGESKGATVMKQKWEYLIDIPALEDVRTCLNTMGEQGWELVTVGNVGLESPKLEINAPAPLQFVFKHPKSES